MDKNKLDAVTFCKILDMFGEEAAQDTLKKCQGDGFFDNVREEK